MDVTPLIRKDQQVIQSYAGGRFRVSGVVYESAVLVYPDAVSEWAIDATVVGDLSFEDFEPLLARAAEIDVVLLGCGASMAFMPADLKRALSDAGLPVDVMDSGAACRTYNVLMAEGRRVVAVLLPI